MNVKSPYVSGLLLLCALSFAARAPAQSTRLVITEGHSIGYATVADALADLESQGLTSTPGANGDVSFVAPDNGTAWTFAGKDNPAYPSVVRYVYTRSSGELHAEVAIRCEASAKPVRSSIAISATASRNCPGRWRAIQRQNAA